VLGGPRWLGGNAARKLVKSRLESSLIKGFAGKAGAKALVKGALKDDVIDAVTKVGLRDAFTVKGRRAFANSFVDIMKSQGINLDENLLKNAALNGARSRAIKSTETAGLAGTLAWGALTTDGDIAKDLYDEAGKLRESRARQLIDGGMKPDTATEQATKEISDPTLGDLGVGGFLAPMTDMFVPYIVGKQVGLFGGSKVSKVIHELGSTGLGKKILKSLPSAIVKEAIPEGFTEAIQAAMSESAKKEFIDQWKEKGLTPEQEMTWVDYIASSRS